MSEIKQESVQKAQSQLNAEYWVRILSGAAWFNPAEANGRTNGPAMKAGNAAAEIIGKASYSLYRS